MVGHTEDTTMTTETLQTWDFTMADQLAAALREAEVIVHMDSGPLSAATIYVHAPDS